MLNENIKTIRKSKGLSQEELAIQLHVVRQTVSKWEQGLSVPDADMLISISEVLDVPVSVLLGETISEEKPNELKVISEKLEIINLQLAKKSQNQRKALHCFFIILCGAIVVIGILLTILGSPYLLWDFSNPEIAVEGTFFHIFEWVFFRMVPFILIGSVIGIILTKKKN